MGRLVLSHFLTVSTASSPRLASSLYSLYLSLSLQFPLPFFIRTFKWWFFLKQVCWWISNPAMESAYFNSADSASKRAKRRRFSVLLQRFALAARCSGNFSQLCKVILTIIWLLVMCIVVIDWGFYFFNVRSFWLFDLHTHGFSSVWWCWECESRTGD